MYQIFDSKDRSNSEMTEKAFDLYAKCDRLNRESEDDGSNLTYAIGKVSSDGNVTFDY